MISKEIERVISFFFEVGSLRKVARAHRQSLLTDDLSDNISSHSFRSAIIGYILAKIEKADIGKVLLMCLIHDLPEARSNDQNWVHKRYVKVFEEEIIKDQLSEIPGENDLLKLAKEYSERKTKEARIAKDADLLDQILLLREYEWSGNEEASIWLKGREQEKRLFSKSAKKLAKDIYIQRPSSWLIGLPSMEVIFL